MCNKTHIFCVLLAVACVTCTGLGAGAQDAAMSIDIGTNEIGAPPAGFDLPPLGYGKQGRWTVVRDATVKAGLAIEQAGIQTSEEIVGVDADIALHSWHTLTIRAKDDEFVVLLDGIWMFTAFDKTLSQAGRVALWTEGDSVTRFDSIAITPLPTEERY